jgi:hypothetical protein
MAYRCNPCRHTSAPFPIARSEWDMKQNAYFCPDCQSDYTLATNKYPNPPAPKGNCGCSCKPCCCRPLCDYKPYKPLSHLDHCFPPHPSVSPPCVIKPSVKPIPPHIVPHPHPIVPSNHPVVPHPVVPNQPIAPPNVKPVPSADLKSFFFY